MYILVYTHLVWLLELVQKLNSKRVPFALVGGYAVALHGAVRGTLDIDLVIPYELGAYESLEAALLSLGLKSRLPVSAQEVFHFRDEYASKRNLVAWSFYHPQEARKIVDVIVTEDLTKLKTKSVSVEQTPVRIVSIEDLIAMKRRSGRPQDIADVEALERLK